MNQYIGYYVYSRDNIKNSRDIEANITLSRHGGLSRTGHILYFCNHYNIFCNIVVDNAAVVMYNNDETSMIGVLDLMKLLCLFLTLLCAAGSVSCNNETLDDVPIVTENTLDSSDNADTIETADAADSITTTSSDDKVTHTDLIEPPLTEYELSLPVPDFLDAKQQLLYRRAYNVYSHLFGCDPYYAEYAETLDYTPDYMPYEVYIFFNEAGYQCRYSQGRYQNWSDFEALYRSVFTERFFDEKNNSSKSCPRYAELDGKLTYCAMTQFYPQFYNENFTDEFELISQSDSEIVFDVIGHYSLLDSYPNESDEARDRRIAESWDLTDKFTIRMVNTESGWRFDEFYHTGIDERTEALAVKLYASDTDSPDRTPLPAEQAVTPLIIPALEVAKSVAELSDDELIEIFVKLTDNYKAYLDINFGFGLEINSEDFYMAKVSADRYNRFCNVLNINNASALKELIGNVFSAQICEDYIYPRLIDGPYCTLFIEYNDKLYFNVDTGGVFPYMIHTDSAAVIERGENSFIISAVVSDVDQTYDKLYEICAEDGRWVLCYDFYVLSDF